MRWRAALDRIITSDGFRSSPQLTAFLSFVVEAVLHGKADRIKGYTIGVEVLKRNKTFDPQIDPIVRVEATRLRRAMVHYYSGPGADDPIRIELVRGSYVPVFYCRREQQREPVRSVLPVAGYFQSSNGMPTVFIRCPRCADGFGRDAARKTL